MDIESGTVLGLEDIYPYSGQCTQVRRVIDNSVDEFIKVGRLVDWNKNDYSAK